MDDWTIKRTADFSECRTWRYTLERVWDERLPVVVFVLLNPSTADENNDDPTNRRGINYAMKWGFGGVTFVNLFAFRTPYPKEMKSSYDPIGPDNNDWLLKEAANRMVVFAWGTHGTYLDRDKEVIKLFQEKIPSPPRCMGLTKHGHPKHILYLKGDLQPVLFNAVENK